MRAEVSLGFGKDEVPVLRFNTNGETKRFIGQVVLNDKLSFKVIVDLFAE